MKDTVILDILRGMAFSIPPNSSYVLIPELSELGTDPKYLCLLQQCYNIQRREDTNIFVYVVFQGLAWLITYISVN